MSNICIIYPNYGRFINTLGAELKCSKSFISFAEDITQDRNFIESLGLINTVRPDALIVEISHTDIEALSKIADFHNQTLTLNLPIIYVASSKWLFNKIRHLKVLRNVEHLSHAEMDPQEFASLFDDYTRKFNRKQCDDDEPVSEKFLTTEKYLEMNNYPR